MSGFKPNGIAETFFSGINGVTHTARGNTAANIVIEHLSGNVKARTIALEVIDFYGDYFTYNESPKLPSSLFEIKMNHDTMGLEYALIKLKLGTDRTAEALSHELLHLSLGKLGYPMGNKVWMPTKLVPYACHLINMQAMVINLLHHELFFETFLELGFTKNHFLSDPGPLPDYDALARDLLLSSVYITELGFPWWCHEYFRHLLSMRHGKGEKPANYINNLIECASRLHPEIKEVTKQISKIIESGALISKANYPDYADKILRLMGMPSYTEWVYLENKAIDCPKKFMTCKKRCAIVYN